MSGKIGQQRRRTSRPRLRIWDSDHVPTVEALARHLPAQTVEQALNDTGRRERRLRKLPAAAVIWILVLSGLHASLDMPGLWRQVCGVLAWLYLLLAEQTPPGRSAVHKARQRLGSRPLRRMLRLLATTPAATATRGAFYQGMRLLAMDGDDYRVCDSPANARVFGKPTTRRKAARSKAKGKAGSRKARDKRRKQRRRAGRGRSLAAGYPVVHTGRLMEIGTHRCLEALLKPYGTNDHTLAVPLLKAASRGDLALWDCGFYGHPAMRAACDRGIQFLGPVPAHVILKPVGGRLSDGSYHAKVYAHPNDRRDDRNGLLVRVIEYTHRDPARVRCGKRHRLVTSLLDEKLHPALQLIGLYHDRWEIEIANDEMTTHLLDRGRPVELRSRKPAGVVQEFYGLVLAHNAVRGVMTEAAARLDVDPRRLSFTHAARVIREVAAAMRMLPAGQLPEVYDLMLREVGRGLLPERDGRIHPRVVKVVRPSKFPVKQKKHQKPPKPKGPFLEIVEVLK